MSGASAEELTRVYHDYRGVLLEVAARVVGRSGAEDALQQGFMKAWRKRGTFQGRSKLSSWVYTFVLREALSEHGRQKRRVGKVLLWEDPDRADPAPSSERVAIARQELNRVVVALEQHPNPHFAPALFDYTLGDHPSGVAMARAWNWKRPRLNSIVSRARMSAKKAVEA